MRTRRRSASRWSRICGPRSSPARGRCNLTALGAACWTPRALGFLERPKTIRRVEDALASQLPILLHGEPGAGKTTLVSHWIREQTGGAEAAILRLRPSWRCRLRSWFARKEVVP